MVEEVQCDGCPRVVRRTVVIAETAKLGQEVEALDGIALQLRVGLNSGQVIAGEIGSSALGYTAIGEQVGIAQRMESVAPPGGVMLSASTARLVEGAAVVGESEVVRIEGAEDAVPARRLVGMAAQRERTGLSESTLVGLEWELATLAAIAAGARLMARMQSTAAAASTAAVGYVTTESASAGTLAAVPQPRTTAV